MKRRENSPMLILLLMMVAALFSGCRSLSDVKGSGKAGGGGSVVIDGETYHLKDLFFKPKEFGSLTFSDEMRERLERLKHELVRALGNAYETRQFFDEHIFKDLVEFRLVKELPNNPTCEQERQSLQKGEELFACTVGWITWIVPKFYQKLSANEKVAAIIHERLHAYAPSQPHAIIMPFVKGLVTMLDLSDLAESGERPQVSESQAESLKEMRYRATQLKLSGLSAKKIRAAHIHRNGGGFLLEGVKADKKTYVDALSFVGAGTFDSTVQVFRSYIRGGMMQHNFRNDVVIQDSSVYVSSDIYDDVTLNGAELYAWTNSDNQNRTFETFVIRQNVRIINSVVRPGQLEGLIENKVTISDSYINGREKLKIQNSRISDCSIATWIISIRSDCRGVRHRVDTRWGSRPTPSYIK